MQFYFKGYTTEEISKILGKKQNTISSWLHRARKKLKVELQGGGTDATASLY
ncbi:sigma-70 family RNA polymerase sigma factor [Proteinivorax hydrogeniformans]|uniref:Sigma-70 family RNA polymerase sigma factor n=1 Tax=Proteinivorax hydrogeniformans TaxID=1826727 RepID=A0AAU8HVM1_9FIRM